MHVQPANDQQLDLYSKESREALAKALTNLFNLWSLSNTEQLDLLGLSHGSRSVLSKYRKGGALPKSRDMLDRAGWLLAIHKALRLLYPYNEDIRYSWIKRRNQLLENKTPLEVMLDEGLVGICKISRYLDHLRGQ